MEKWWSANEIVKELGMSETTVRRYLGEFEEFMQGRQYGRATKYPYQALEITSTIYRLYQEGKNTSEIKDILKAKYQQVIEIKPEIANLGSVEMPITVSNQEYLELVKLNNILIRQNTDALKQISEVLTRVLDQDQEIEQLREEIRVLKDRQSIFERFKSLFSKGGNKDV